MIIIKGISNTLLSSLICILLFRGHLFCNQVDETEIQRMEEMARSVTIYRDTYGVPHIYGPTDASVVLSKTATPLPSSQLLMKILIQQSSRST